MDFINLKAFKNVRTGQNVVTLPKMFGDISQVKVAVPKTVPKNLFEKWIVKGGKPCHQ